MRIAVYQCALGGSSREERLRRLRIALRDPQAAGADLVVCPELFMTGYNVSEDIGRLAEPVDGPFAQSIACLAREHGTAILYGYPEREGPRIYNSAAWICRDGALLANHRKLALPPGFETHSFERGDEATVVTFGHFKLALLVCYDIEFPEVVRGMALQGAHAVIAPTALTSNWSSVATRMVPTRALENGLYVIYANHAGRERDADYLGASCIVGPDGEDLARAGLGEQVVSANLDLTAITRARLRLPYLNDVARLASRLRSQLPNAKRPLI
ncbi:carbon-nitrogen hydrolase family protein [Bradyrhizobium lupini]